MTLLAMPAVLSPRAELIRTFRANETLQPQERKKQDNLAAQRLEGDCEQRPWVVVGREIHKTIDCDERLSRD
jgi:hypothetical protein